MGDSESDAAKDQISVADAPERIRTLHPDPYLAPGIVGHRTEEGQDSPHDIGRRRSGQASAANHDGRLRQDGRATARGDLSFGHGLSSGDFAELARAYGVVLSVGRKGECLFTGYSSVEGLAALHCLRFLVWMLDLTVGEGYRCS